MADQTQGSRRVELVATSSPDATEAWRTGLGLLVGLFVGRSSLVGAATGSERFEVAIAHFVGVVLVSVAGVLLLGVLWDQAQRSIGSDQLDGTEAPEEPVVGASELPISSTS